MADPFLLSLDESCARFLVGGKAAGLTTKDVRYRVEPHLPADVLGCYIIAPVVS